MITPSAAFASGLLDGFRRRLEDIAASANMLKTPEHVRACLNNLEHAIVNVKMRGLASNVVHAESYELHARLVIRMKVLAVAHHNTHPITARAAENVAYLGVRRSPKLDIAIVKASSWAHLVDRIPEYAFHRPAIESWLHHGALDHHLSATCPSCLRKAYDAGCEWTCPKCGHFAVPHILLQPVPWLPKPQSAIPHDYSNPLQGIGGGMQGEPGPPGLTAGADAAFAEMADGTSKAVASLKAVQNAAETLSITLGCSVEEAMQTLTKAGTSLQAVEEKFVDALMAGAPEPPPAGPLPKPRKRASVEREPDGGERAGEDDRSLMETCSHCGTSGLTEYSVTYDGGKIVRCRECFEKVIQKKIPSNPFQHDLLSPLPPFPPLADLPPKERLVKNYKPGTSCATCAAKGKDADYYVRRPALNIGLLTLCNKCNAKYLTAAQVALARMGQTVADATAAEALLQPPPPYVPADQQAKPSQPPFASDVQAVHESAKLARQRARELEDTERERQRAASERRPQTTGPERMIEL